MNLIPGIGIDTIRSALETQHGAGNYRISEAGEIRVRGTMKREELWFFTGWTDDRATLALLGIELPARPAWPKGAN